MKQFTPKKRQLRQLILLACMGIILFCTQSVNAQIDSSCRPQIIVTDTKLGYEGELNDTCKQRLTTFSDAFITQFRISYNNLRTAGTIKLSINRLSAK